MSHPAWAFLIAVGLCVVGVVGDYFLKLASDEDSLFANRWFALGLLVFSSTAFGWAYVMRHMKLATMGVVYAVSMILLLAVMGALFFDEKLSYGEMVGVALAVVSVLLLSRFAD